MKKNCFNIVADSSAYQVIFSSWLDTNGPHMGYENMFMIENDIELHEKYVK